MINSTEKVNESHIKSVIQKGGLDISLEVFLKEENVGYIRDLALKLICNLIGEDEIRRDALIESPLIMELGEYFSIVETDSDKVLTIVCVLLQFLKSEPFPDRDSALIIM